MTLGALMALMISAADGGVEPSMVFVADPLLSMEPAVRTMSSLHRIVFSYDEQLRRALSLDERRPLQKTAGVVGRLAKLIFVDFPLVDFEMLILHEVFGHGTRGREAGLSPSYAFGLPDPYRLLWPHPDQVGAVTHGAYSPTLERELGVRAGGIEVEQVAAHWINLELMQRGGRLHYSDQLKYIVLKTTYLSYLGSNLLGSDESSSKDPKAYYFNLQQRFNVWTHGARAQLADRIQVGYWLSYLDPTLWLSAFHLLVTTLYKGEANAQLPQLKVAGWGLFLGTRFNLSPAGLEQYLDLYLGREGKVIDVYFRTATSGLTPSMGLGVRALGFRPHQAITLGGELDVWYQPELLFEYPGVFNPPHRMGFSAGAHLEVKVLGWLGLIGKLAFKTRGHLMGQPFDGGFFGYVGLSIAPSAEGALLQFQ